MDNWTLLPVRLFGFTENSIWSHTRPRSFQPEDHASHIPLSKGPLLMSGAVVGEAAS